MISLLSASGSDACLASHPAAHVGDQAVHANADRHDPDPRTPVFDAKLDTALRRAMDRLHGLPDAQRRVEEFIAHFGAPPPGAGFKYIAPEARTLHAKVVATIGANGAAAFLFACVLAAVRASLNGERLKRLPARVQMHQLRQFTRIANHDQGFLDHCRLEGDVFLKEFGLATLRLYAGASSVIDPYSGVGRSLLLSGGIRQLLERAWFFARAGGFKPYFEVHVHKLYLDEFDEQGRNECYRCCAELYEVHPENLGMFAGSWFYDPAIAEISPRLAFLRAVPVAGGARCMFQSYNDQAIANATATSPTRRALHAAGQYRPAAYALVWPRRAQIAWAKPAPAATVAPTTLRTLLARAATRVRAFVLGAAGGQRPAAGATALTPKTAVLYAVKFLGLFALVRMVTRKQPRILCYHAGSIGDERHYNPKLFCTREQLRQRLAWLRRHGFTPARLDEITQPGASRKPGIPVAVTLDDGWYSTYRDLLPSLAEFGYEPVLYLHSAAYDMGVPIIPVTLRYLLWKAGPIEVVLDGFGFGMGRTWNLADPRERQRLCATAEQWLAEQDPHSVAGSLKRFAARLGISADQLALESRRFSYMTQEELLRASEAGCRIELHGHEHVYEPGQPRRNRENIELNRERIRELGLPYPKHYCYPSGSFDEHAPEVMRAAGIDSATTCAPGLVDLRDPDARYYLPRFLDGGDVSMIEFEAEMSGVSQLLRRFARRGQRPHRSLRPLAA